MDVHCWALTDEYYQAEQQHYQAEQQHYQAAQQHYQKLDPSCLDATCWVATYSCWAKKGETLAYLGVHRLLPHSPWMVERHRLHHQRGLRHHHRRLGLSARARPTLPES